MNLKFLIMVLIVSLLAGCLERTPEQRRRSAEMFERMSAGESFGQAVGNAKRTEQGLPPIVSRRNAQGRVKQASMTCLSEGEQISGFNKICYYDCLGDLAAITVSSASLCPLSIER